MAIFIVCVASKSHNLSIYVVNFVAYDIRKELGLLYGTGLDSCLFQFLIFLFCISPENSREKVGPGLFVNFIYGLLRVAFNVVYWFRFRIWLFKILIQ